MVTLIKDQISKRLKVRFDSSTIGYVVRNMKEVNESISLFEQHADCVLSTGEPVGFFARNPARDNGSVAETFTTCDGAVFGYEKMNRLSYDLVNETYAKENAFSSGVLLIQSNDPHDERLIKFNTFWEEAKAAKKGNAGVFNNFKRNCATYAYYGFEAAGLVEGRMSFLIDTPCALFRHVLKCAKQKGYQVTCYLGYVGFSPQKKDFRGRAIGSEYEMTILDHRSHYV